MERILFYFDPLCPWCWLTSLWIREVQKHSNLEVEWKLFSLAEVNNYEDPVRFGPVRIAALARREGGNEAADKAYLALGGIYHEQGQRPGTVEELINLAEPALQAQGLDPSLASRALDDASTLEEVLADHREAVDRYGAFGVPWIALEEPVSGFFGPVIGAHLEGQQALDLWNHTRWSLEQPYLFELKRGRQELPSLKRSAAAQAEARS